MKKNQNKSKTEISLKSSCAAGEWDANSKEPWYLELEKEPVNDEKWSCIVTVAIPSEVQGQECIQKYNQCVNTGLRRAIKIITMADVIKLLKGNNGSKNSIKTKTSNTNMKNKKEKATKPAEQDNAEKSESGFILPASPFSKIIDLAAKYATFTDIDCKLPANLMAAVIKYLILNLKDESCWQKKIEAVRERKKREINIKAKFIRELKPYEMSQEEAKLRKSSIENLLRISDPINDEPIEGPDLYIMLVDFYDLYIFPEMERMNLPLLAILKVSTIRMPELMKESSVSFQKPDVFENKRALIVSFWEKFQRECSNWETVDKFKNILTIEYQLTGNQSGIRKVVGSKLKLYNIIFNELSWMQYSIYYIYRQYQKYLKELHVQRLFLSLEPLDLSKCAVYNKLCDALITGESVTPMLVLYAIIEQVVVGVPETNSMILEYQPQPTDFFSDGSQNVKNLKEGQKQKTILVTPCFKCRDKNENVCDKLKEDVRDGESSEYSEWSQTTDENLESSTPSDTENKQYLIPSEEETNSFSTGCIISESFLDQALSEKRAEKDTRKSKKWKTPSLCFFGDSIFLQTYDCEPRLFDSKTLTNRFLKNSHLPRLWLKYPELSPGERAFFNFHFQFLKEISKNSDEFLKLQIFFSMSMKLIGIAKSYLYRGEEEVLSDVILGGGKEKLKKLSKVKFNKDVFNDYEVENNFSAYFRKTFIRDTYQTEPKNTKKKLDAERKKTDSDILHKVKSRYDISPPPENSVIPRSPNVTNFGNTESDPQQSRDRELIILYSLLECSEISYLTQPHLISNEESFRNFIHSFTFYEKIEPHVMIQRLIEGQENFNMTQCTYFSPTDTLLIIMYNECDHRGISYDNSSQTLRTPVSFRDFYFHVYGDINSWLTEELEEHTNFVSHLEKKFKKEREKKDLEYLTQLKRNYCQMNEEERKEFLETDLDIQPELEPAEKELEELPTKPKHPCPNKVSFVTTNFMDVRVRVTRKLHEFYSKDGTEVNAQIENWLYTPSSLLGVKVKRSNFRLYYYQWLGQKIETSFTFKTTSDIIFSFYKTDSEEGNNFNYNLTISWPIGLLIQPITLQSSTYIKQSYLKVYRKGWDIEEETSRCFLKNGQIIIFKEYGGYDILCPSGMKYAFFDSAATPKYEITSTTGEIWEVQTKNRCKNRSKSLISTLKVFIGFDPTTQETFYKREDGVYCMLWPNGKLVTTYPDGTKITTIPDFDTDEISVEWTEEEKLSYKIIQSKINSKFSLENQSQVVNKSSSTLTERKSRDSYSNNNDSFVSISCTYLMEHPKYSTVYFNPCEDTIRVSMVEDLNVFVYPKGNYKILKENHSLNVCGSTAEFCTKCKGCKNLTTVKLNFNADKILCECVDFFDKVFILLRNGGTKYQENSEIPENGENPELKLEEEATSAAPKTCPNDHNKNVAFMQKCFVLERDLSGVEFLHKDLLAFYSDKLSKDTYFEINTQDPYNMSHTFSSPYYKLGYENWMMDYEDKDNSLPTNLKKKDLKEMGVKEVSKNTFKQPFPSGYNCRNQRQSDNPKPEQKQNIEMPKLIMVRTIKSWPHDPNSVINDLHKKIDIYQQKVHDIWKKYKKHKEVDSRLNDSRYVKMRLKKIALTLSQSLQMYPHLCTQYPSTEKDIHYFGHFINSMTEMKSHFKDTSIIPDCKQLPIPLPRRSNFPSIHEESESPRST